MGLCAVQAALDIRFCVLEPRPRALQAGCSSAYTAARRSMSSLWSSVSSWTGERQTRGTVSLRSAC